MFKKESILLLIVSFIFSISITSAVNNPVPIGIVWQTFSADLVRKSLTKKYPSTANMYCDDYWASNGWVTAWCGKNYHLTKSDLLTTILNPTNPNLVNCVNKWEIIPKRITFDDFQKPQLQCCSWLEDKFPSNAITRTFDENWSVVSTVQTSFDKMCMNIADQSCESQYEDEYNSVNDCKKTYTLWNVETTSELATIKYSYKDIKNNNLEITFKYKTWNASEITLDDKTWTIVLSKTSTTQKIEAWKTYEYKIYDKKSGKFLWKWNFTANPSSSTCKSEWVEIISWESASCCSLLTKVPVKTAYSSTWALSNSYNFVCIKKADWVCSDKENKYNSASDCNWNWTWTWTTTCSSAPEIFLNSNCTATEVKNSSGCVVNYTVSCDTQTGTWVTADINLDECSTDYFPICWSKSSVKKTYVNFCFALKDTADILYAWECNASLRDTKWCLASSSLWCDWLKRCVLKWTYCQNFIYNPNIDSSIKTSIRWYLDKFYEKLENKLSNSEERLKTIDNISTKIDLVISEHTKYKAILYFIIQEVEAKRIKYLSN